MSGSKRSLSGWALVAVGAVLAIGSAIVGYVWLAQVPDLSPVAFGESEAFTASESGTATVFTPTGLSTPATCQVSTRDGQSIELVEVGRYQQSEGLESSYGFAATAGSTYTVTCGGLGESGQFAVAQMTPFPQTAFIAVGSLGLLLCVVGAVLARRSSRAASMGRPH